jgi:hypothetical protein
MSKNLCLANGRILWKLWFNYFLLKNMHNGEAVEMLRSGIEPVFDTENMEEWRTIEGHLEIVVKPKWGE